MPIWKRGWRPSQTWTREGSRLNVTSARAVAVKAIKSVNAVRRFVKKSRETKYVDVNASDAEVIGYIGDVTLLTPVAQGNGQSQRTGNKITGRYVNIRGYVDNNGLQPGTAVRFLVVMDTQNTGTAPAASDVLSITGDNQAVVAPINLLNVPRFIVLYDRLMTTSTNGNDKAYFKKFIRLRNRGLHFTGTGAGNPGRNAVYSIAIANVNTNDPTLTFVSRFAYTDS